jgi:tRNA dimethylallyltransferase
MSLAKGKKIVILIAGPTAVGKTSVAISIAKHFGTEIISADSRQCYKELDIGVARPSAEQLDAVPHHFIASHSILDEINAGSFEQYALQKADEIFKGRDLLVMTGGTGLYIKAFCEGMDDIPEVPVSTREEIVRNYESGGLEWLQQQVMEKDPAFYAAGEVQNPQRLMRALEVVVATGRSILDFRKGKKKQRSFEVIRIGLQLPREELHRNIEVRTEAMISQGLVEEVERLRSFKSLNALQTVGYSEIFEYLDGQASLGNATAEIKKHTRQYAKRQMTWFKKDTSMQWFPPSPEAILSSLQA